MNPNYLDEQEQSAIVRFNTDPVMVRAVRKVLEATIQHQGVFTPGDTGTDKNWVFSVVSAMDNNEKLGEMVRASAAGLGYLSAGFERLNEIQVPVPKKEKKNDAL